MIDDVLGDFVVAPKRALTKQELARKKRHRLAVRARARQEESLLPLIDSATQFVVRGISDELRASYKDPETRRRERELHAERMRLLHVKLPRLMEKIHDSREKRIMSAARLIAWEVFHYLKVQAKRRIGAKILLSRRNFGCKRDYFKALHEGFRHRRLCRTIDRVLHWPLMKTCAHAWRQLARHERLRLRYCHAVISSNSRTRLVRLHMSDWKLYVTHLQRLKAALRNIALSSSNVRPALNSWRIYTKQQKELKRRLRRKMMGLKQAALHAWYEITNALQEHRMYVYDKFSRRLRHRFLLRPFSTLRDLWQRGRCACTIQTAVRKRQACRRMKELRQITVHNENLRGTKEIANVLRAEKEILNRINSMLRSSKTTSSIMQPAKREVKRLQEMALSQQKFRACSDELPSPRSRLLRPLLACHDLDLCGLTRLSHVHAIGRGLGFPAAAMDRAMESCKVSTGLVDRDVSDEYLTETDVKQVFDAAQLDPTKGFVIKMRRKWRSWRGAGIIESAKTHLRDISVVEARRDARMTFRLADGKPPFSCSGCGKPFALYRQLKHHEKDCGDVKRRVAIAEIQSGLQSTNSTTPPPFTSQSLQRPRVTLTSLVHESIL